VPDSAGVAMRLTEIAVKLVELRAIRAIYAREDLRRVRLGADVACTNLRLVGLFARFFVGEYPSDVL